MCVRKFLLLCGVGVTCSHLPGWGYESACKVARFLREGKGSEHCKCVQKFLLARRQFYTYSRD